MEKNSNGTINFFNNFVSNGICHRISKASLSLLLISLSPTSGTSSSGFNHHLNIVRGVEPENQNLFTQQKFSCDGGSTIIDKTAINDNFCDCKDGKDEPGTNACPDGLFHCVNEGFIGTNIHSTFVNDGVCDCCDGSDEYLMVEAGAAKCANTCFDFILKRKAELVAEREVAKKAFAKKEEMIAKTKMEIESDQKEKDQKSAELLEASKKLDELSEKTKNLKEQIDMLKSEEEVLMRKGMIFDEVNETTEHTSDHTSIHTSIHPSDYQEEDGEGKGNNDDYGEEYVEEYDEEYEDGPTEELVEKTQPEGSTEELQEGMYDQMHKLRDLESQKREMYQQQREHEMRQQEINNYMYAKLALIEGDVGYISSDSNTVPNNDGTEVVLPDFPEDVEATHTEDLPVSSNPIPSNEITRRYSKKVQHLVELFIDNNKKNEQQQILVSGIQERIKKLDKYLDPNSDYGVDNEFYTMRDLCLDAHEGKHSYNFCLFKEITQDRWISIGKDFKWGKKGDDDKLTPQAEAQAEVDIKLKSTRNDGNTDKYKYMKYTGGHSCPPARSTLVTLKCGEENKISNVNEPNMCVYTMDLYTPAACPHPDTLVDVEKLSDRELAAYVMKGDVPHSYKYGPGASTNVNDIHHEEL